MLFFLIFTGFFSFENQIFIIMYYNKLYKPYYYKILSIKIFTQIKLRFKSRPIGFINIFLIILNILTHKNKWNVRIK